MKCAGWQRLVLAADDVALGNVQRVKSVEIEDVQVDLIGFRRELLPDRARVRFRSLLDEMVSKHFGRPFNLTQPEGKEYR